jgi:multicomponent Na+:H+ antiporter subunit E
MKLFALALLFVRELLVSAIRVAWLAVQPRLKLRPAIVSYPLTVSSDAEISLLANLITLTPGTLSIDVSDDRKWLSVHCLDSPGDEQVIDTIAGGFETRVMQVFR